MPADTIRHRLRAATQSRHAILDTLVGPLQSASTYRTYLAGIAAFRLCAEQHLNTAAWPDILGSWQPRRLSTLLMEDLHDLSLTPPAPDIVLTPDTPARTMGLLYVLEGSALGARVLVRQAAALGFDNSCGARHLTTQAGAGYEWQSFLHCLEQIPDDTVVITANAAAQTFDAAILAMRTAIELRL